MPQVTKEKDVVSILNATYLLSKTLSITALCRFLNRVLEPAAGTA